MLATLVKLVMPFRLLVGGTLAARHQSQLQASNVTVVTLSRPGQLHGYEIELTIWNRSHVGISEVSIFVSVVGEMVNEGRVVPSETIAVPHALAAGERYEHLLPHLVRFDSSTFGLDLDRPGTTTTIFWKDEAGRRWVRTDACVPERCRAGRFPDAGVG